MSYKQQMLDLYNEFCEATGKRTATTGEMARWAIISYQLKQDVDSYNEFYNKGEQIQLPLDFGPDVAEQEQIAKNKKRAA